MTSSRCFLSFVVLLFLASMILVVVVVSFHDLMLVQLVMTMKLRLSFLEFVSLAKIVSFSFSLSEVPLKFAVVVVVVDEVCFCVGLF